MFCFVMFVCWFLLMNILDELPSCCDCPLRAVLREHWKFGLLDVWLSCSVCKRDRLKIACCLKQAVFARSFRIILWCPEIWRQKLENYSRSFKIKISRIFHSDTINLNIPFDLPCILPSSKKQKQKNSDRHFHTEQQRTEQGWYSSAWRMVGLKMASEAATSHRLHEFIWRDVFFKYFSSRRPIWRKDWIWNRERMLYYQRKTWPCCKKNDQWLFKPEFHMKTTDSAIQSDR